MKEVKAKKQDKTGEILEIVNFIKDNAVTREEFHTEIGKIKAEMVTKDYLDDKLADLRGDLVVLTRKEDGKVKELVKILESKKVLNKSEVKKILAMEPFPVLAL